MKTYCKIIGTVWSPEPWSLFAFTFDGGCVTRSVTFSASDFSYVQVCFFSWAAVWVQWLSFIIFFPWQQFLKVGEHFVVSVYWSLTTDGQDTGDWWLRQFTWPTYSSSLQKIRQHSLRIHRFWTKRRGNHASLWWGKFTGFDNQHSLVRPDSHSHFCTLMSFLSASGFCFLHLVEHANESEHDGHSWIIILGNNHKDTWITIKNDRKHWHPVP